MKTLLLSLLAIFLLAKNDQLPSAEIQDFGQPTILIFSGSDWCKPCIALKKKLNESAEWKGLTAEKITVQYVDFPYKKANKLSKEQQAKNDALAERYNPGGLFPYVVVVGDEGELLGTIKSRKPVEMTEEVIAVMNRQ